MLYQPAGQVYTPSNASRFKMDICTAEQFCQSHVINSALVRNIGPWKQRCLPIYHHSVFATVCPQGCEKQYLLWRETLSRWLLLLKCTLSFFQALHHSHANSSTPSMPEDWIFIMFLFSLKGKGRKHGQYVWRLSRGNTIRCNQTHAHYLPETHGCTQIVEPFCPLCYWNK